ncbi:MAG TPA: aspartate/glutamate racemase family protein [Casimicrobiaceae bacterium]|nr:aspartate/glutamate racemase family protein [Casimicrobiaceae bacterium]
MTHPTISVIHTSPATVELFGRLLREHLPAARVANLLDDSILPQLRDNGGDVSAIAPRWNAYARIARDMGADVILNACSSIGELCEPQAQALGIPIVRVDARMAREAIMRGRRIAVVATLSSTLRPTRDVILDTARLAGRHVTVTADVVDGAYATLIAGDPAGHDERVTAALRTACAEADVVVLAQASMARVLPRLTEDARAKCLVSPPLAVADVVEALASR